VKSGELERAMDLAAGYLVRNTDPEGRFTYLDHLDPDQRVRRDYNMLRHAGTIYALASWHGRRGGPDAEGALLRARDFLLGTVAPARLAGDSALAVWSRPEIVRQPLVAKLGGAGLGLVALATLERTLPGSAPLDTMRALARFITWMQRPDGSFVSRYRSGRGMDSSWTSLYYPGEAVLGLVMLHELDRDPRWLEAALAGLDYLARQREGRLLVPPDHWALIATGRVLPLLRDEAGDGARRERLLAHASRVARVMLWHARGIRMVPLSVPGSLNLDGRTTPTATKLEGLGAMLPAFTEARPAQARAAARALREGVAFLVAAQQREGLLAGAIPRGAKQWPLYFPPDRRQRFNDRVGEVRVDYVQHALSAMLTWAELREGWIPR
jgi:hypothetical protein